MTLSIFHQDVDDNNVSKLHHLRATGRKTWRGKEPRWDDIWVRIQSIQLHPMCVTGHLKCFRRRVIGFLHALFILRAVNKEVCRLAHVPLLDWVGNAMPHSHEGRLYIKELLVGVGRALYSHAALKALDI